MFHACPQSTPKRSAASWKIRNSTSVPCSRHSASGRSRCTRALHAPSRRSTMPDGPTGVHSMPIINRIAEYHREMTEWRHDLHAHPELALQEIRTSGVVQEKLKSFG